MFSHLEKMAILLALSGSGLANPASDPLTENKKSESTTLEMGRNYRYRIRLEYVM
jgi:hypothetical protein